MKRKYFFFLPLLLVLLVPCFLNLGIVGADDPEKTRETIRSQLKHIANFMDGVRSHMTNAYGAVSGNILKGNSGWGSSQSLNRAVTRAFRECENQGGGCEEIYTVCVHNNTPENITVYLFQPWETDFSNSNSLWNWSMSPGQEFNLGVDGSRLFISKRFYLKGEYTDGSKQWNARKIDEYSCQQRNYRDGWNLKIRLIP